MQGSCTKYEEKLCKDTAVVYPYGKKQAIKNYSVTIPNFYSLPSMQYMSVRNKSSVRALKEYTPKSSEGQGDRRTGEWENRVGNTESGRDTARA